MIRLKVYLCYLTILASLQILAMGQQFTVNNVTREQGITIIDNIATVNKVLNDQRLLKYFELIERVVGQNLEVHGEKDMDSYYFRWTFAYHIGFPANIHDWRGSQFHVNEEYYIPLNQVRKRQELWEYMKNFVRDCQKQLNFIFNNYNRRNDAELREKKKFYECLEMNTHGLKHLLANRSNDEHNIFFREVQVSVINSVYIFAAEIVFQLSLDSSWTGYFDINLPNDPTLVSLSPYTRMSQEANDDSQEIESRLVAFQNMIDNNITDQDRKKHFQEKLDEIKKELQEPPFDTIYDNNGIPSLQFRADCLYTLGTYFNDEMVNVTPWLLQEAEAWREDGSLLDNNEAYLELVLDQSEAFYNKFIKVDQSNVTKEWVWDWDLNNEDTCAHFTRISWELLDQVVEKLKCYMRQTYYFDLREQALQATQLDLKTARLFSNMSTTLHRPCRINNDSDLVTDYCTRENHEVCAPMFFWREKGQNPEFENTGGLSLLRPKAYFKMDEETQECKQINAYIVPYKACHCGFRLDCGKEFGKNLTCQLKDLEDGVRRQCRGDVAYPCKSMPLAVGRHHESCLSGYCDMEADSCEDRPSVAVRKDNTANVVKVEGILVYLYLACLVIRQGI